MTITNRTFGIEIEAYNLTQREVAAALNAAGVEAHVEGYNHSTRRYWKVITDASLNGVNAFELVSPVLQGEAGIEEARKALNAIERAGAKVNKSCGVHVHFGAQDLQLADWKAFFKMYAKYERGIDALLPRSRRGSSNYYCQSLLARWSGNLENFCSQIDAASSLQDISTLFGSSHAARYHKVNLQSFWRYGTVEIRHHSGSVEAEKVLSWVELMMSMIEFARSPYAQIVEAQPEQDWSSKTAKDVACSLLAAIGNKRLNRFYKARRVALA